MYSITKYVGFDVSKEKIAVAAADPGIGPARSIAVIENTQEKIKKTPKRLGELDEHTYAMRRELWDMGSHAF